MCRTALSLLFVSTLLLGSCREKETPAPAPPSAAAPKPQATEMKLFHDPGESLAANADASAAALRIDPGSDAEAQQYYNDIRPALVDFPRTTLQESTISDMLVYCGYPALLAKDIEALDPAVLMDFAQLRTKVSNAPDFEVAYSSNPLKAGELVATRFFAPKIINVRDAQVDGVPKGGFGWRKVVRFRTRDGSKARVAGLASFYLLFNFATQEPKFPPAGTHAGQLQALLQPIYPHGDKHRDLYFFVYEALGSTNPEKMGTFLVASFDLAGVVPDDKYFVPRACGQCHGTSVSDQKNAKVNYLDTDHWIDRTGDDFKKVPAGNVIVDGQLAPFFTLNTEIESQNTAVIGVEKFALLAVKKWLDLHRPDGADANRHVPPLRRGFVENSGDANWTADASLDKELVPLLNQYCFRCHSSVAYHVFQKADVASLKSAIRFKLDRGSMPQDRKLDDATKQRMIELVQQLP